MRTQTGGRYSHRIRSPAAVALLADDGRAEVLGVGEGESVERLRRGRQATAKGVSATLSDAKSLCEISCVAEGRPNTRLALCKVTRSLQAERGAPQGLLIAVVEHCGDERLLGGCRRDGSPQKHTLKRCPRLLNDCRIYDMLKSNYACVCKA